MSAPIRSREIEAITASGLVGLPYGGPYGGPARHRTTDPQGAPA
ncbi:hypothetical protein [Streptomyces sp. NPDC048650]